MSMTPQQMQQMLAMYKQQFPQGQPAPPTPQQQQMQGINMATAGLGSGAPAGANRTAGGVNGAAQLIVGPGGLILLGARSGFVRSTTARAVFDADDFDYRLGTDEYVHHRKAASGRRVPKEDVQKAITHAYCVLQMATPAKHPNRLTTK